MKYFAYPGLYKNSQSLFRYNTKGDRVTSSMGKLECVKVAIYHLMDFKWERVIGRERSGDLTKARCIVSAFIYDPPFISTVHLAKILHRDHTSILYYLNLHKDLLGVDAHYVKLFESAKSFL